MNTLKVATWNIENFHLNNNNIGKSCAIINLLTDEGIDILALQAVNPLLVEEITKRLERRKNGYAITTPHKKYINPIKNISVEYNVIVSKLDKMTQGRHDMLPKFELCKKRNITWQMLEDNVILNIANIDPNTSKSRRRQLDEVIKLIEKQTKYGSFDACFAGTINESLTEENMSRFQKKIAARNMQMVTLSDHRSTDAIVLAKNWQVESVKVIDQYDIVSSHRPMIVKVRKYSK
ncbi:MAG: hypothetical protein PUB18_05095 [bacterium]|nr:hypothetical protein [bacterium]